MDVDHIVKNRLDEVKEVDRFQVFKGNAHHLGLKRTLNGSTKLNMQ